MNITILGAGTWGTALGILLSSNGHKVTMCSAIEKEVKNLDKNRSNIKNLPGAVLPEDVLLTADIETALKVPDLIVMAVASPYVRQTSQKIAPLIKDGTIIVDVAKGIEENTLMTLSQIIKEEIPQADVAILSGPTHAEEVSRKIPTTIVAGAHSRKTAIFIQDAFMNSFFRVYTSPDMIGIEIGAALKNVIALAAGVVDGLGYGDNTKAALITRGITEISRLGTKIGGKYETFCGLSGIGDLIVTCTSNHSRNHNAGYLIGQGKTAKEACEEVGQVVEGVNSARAALLLANKYNVDMPIVNEVNDVLFNGKTAVEAIKALFERDKTDEHKSISWE